MSDKHETLKAWCHWKRKEIGVSEDDLEFVKAIEDVISEVGTWKAKYKRIAGQANVDSSPPTVNQGEVPESARSHSVGAKHCGLLGCLACMDIKERQTKPEPNDD